MHFPARYWPDNSQRSVLYADIEVTLLTESIEYEEFTIRELRLTNLAESSQSHRTVQHLHYQVCTCSFAKPTFQCSTF